MLTTHAANGQAARGHSASLARALKGLGMLRCSEYLVRRQWDDPDRPSWYCLWWRWYEALWLAHREGAEFLFEDFCARVARLRSAAPTVGAEDWHQLVARSAREHGQAIAAAVEMRDEAAVRRGLVESIATTRDLLALLDRPAARDDARRKAA